MKSMIRAIKNSDPLIHLAVTVNVGSNHDYYSKEGMAHMLEHMCLRGAGPYNSDELDEKISEIGSLINAYTTEEQTCYYLTFEREHFFQAAEILGHIVLRPLLKSDILEIERKVILGEIKEYLDSSDDIADSLLEKASKGGRFNSGRSLGSPSSVKRITRYDLKRFHKRYYVQGKIGVCAIGDIPRNALKALTEIFGLNVNKDKKEKANQITYTRDLEINKSQKSASVRILWPCPVNNSQEETAGNLLGLALGGISKSSLYPLRSDKGLGYTFMAHFQPNHNNSCIMVSMNGHNSEKMKNGAIDILNNFEWDQKTFDYAKKSARIQVLQSFQNPLEMAQEISYTLSQGKNIQSPDVLLRKIENADLKTAQKILNRMKAEQPTIAIVNPEKAT